MEQERTLVAQCFDGLRETPSLEFEFFQQLKQGMFVAS
jgi:hypothetical protein